MNRYGLTRLEKITIGVVLIVVFLVLIPLYRQLVDIKYTSDCLSNLKEIATALTLYQTDFNNTLPIAYYAHSNGEPVRDEHGRPLCWIHSISGYVRKDPARVFKCPADPLGGSTEITHPRNPAQALRISYGFFLPLSAQKLESIPSPSSAILIADSVAGGQMGTIDPNPLAGGNDGFVLTFDAGLLHPTAQSRFIARLAVWRRNPEADWSADNLRSFHAKGVNVLHADGHVTTRSPSILLIERDSQGRIQAPWSLPLPPGFSSSREHSRNLTLCAKAR